VNACLVLKAAEFAARKHRDQRRMDIESSPYINHPISVALLIAQVGNIEDPEILAAALLHDTLEDTDTSVAELLAEFNETVSDYVQEVTDDQSLAKKERKQLQIDHAAALSRGATLIKFGDKISNVRDVTHSPPEGW
jgi:(p)ppGpp synthase/HD superfamily hydrolase